MSKIITFKPIGAILREADLISTPQLELALRDQVYNRDLRLGEILALRGWIDQDTANFFAQEWFEIISRRIEHPIGFYLQKAGLLKEKDIKRILNLQHQYSLRFGDTAVKQRLVKPNTINFFLQNLFPLQLDDSRKAALNVQQQQEDKITKEDITYWVKSSLTHITNV